MILIVLVLLTQMLSVVLMGDCDDVAVLILCHSFVKQWSVVRKIHPTHFDHFLLLNAFVA